MLAILGELCWLQFFKTVSLETSNVRFGSFFQNPVTYIVWLSILTSKIWTKCFKIVYMPCLHKLLSILSGCFHTFVYHESITTNKFVCPLPQNFCPPKLPSLQYCDYRAVHVYTYMYTRSETIHTLLRECINSGMETTGMVEYWNGGVLEWWNELF